ncbi:jg23433 [Pararge aegeria aegeria]|uniref:Jg23433 protein n=1 Tax=Pararge aegeria aegeria TaxID=348720 RepID=A0A8S4S487_9NEOP|nr:jg23433 [Pararge aegeria aegeria]
MGSLLGTRLPPQSEGVKATMRWAPDTFDNIMENSQACRFPLDVSFNVEASDILIAHNLEKLEAEFTQDPKCNAAAGQTLGIVLLMEMVNI